MCRRNGILILQGLVLLVLVLSLLGGCELAFSCAGAHRLCSVTTVPL